jgi:hypothetical protein
LTEASTAVERRFGREYQAAGVFVFVGELRARSERIAQGLDPDIAERVIRVVYGDGSLGDRRPRAHSAKSSSAVLTKKQELARSQSCWQRSTQLPAQ